MLHRRSIAAFGVISLLLLGGCGSSPDGEVIPVKQRKPVSHAAFRDAAGVRSTLADRHGKVVVVDVWATWCPPCRASLPELAALQRKGGEAYDVVAVSVDRKGWEAVTPFLAANKELGLHACVPDGSDGLAPFGSVNVIPTTLVIDRQGRIRTRLTGYAPGRVEKALKEALAEKG